MTINGLVAAALQSLKEGGYSHLFLCAFAIGFGFACGIFVAASFFNLLPWPGAQ